MPAGITSQYGFLFQRYVFINVALERASMDRFFVYEGVDDIDVSEEHRIYSIKDFDKTFIQVKSGAVSRECWAKVLGNWLLIDEEMSEYRITLENELSFDIFDNEIISFVCDYFINGSTKASSSISNKVFKKYIEGQKSAEENLRKRIMDLLGFVSLEVVSFDDISKRIDDIFSSTYCPDIKIYEVAKKCRCERFLEYINAQIDDAIKEKSSYTLRYADLYKEINRATSDISDGKYSIDIGEMKRRKKSEAEAILNNDSFREVTQLRKVNSNNGFIISELIKELLYRDFRAVYCSSNSTLISNVEETAYSNYEDAVYSLGEDLEPKKVFDETMSKDIPLSIVENSPIYRNGCYVFLTGNEIDSSRQISWGKDDE